MLAALCVATSAASETMPAATNAATLARHVYRQPTAGISFAFEAKVAALPWSGDDLVLEDGSGCVLVEAKPFRDEAFTPGETLSVTGYTLCNDGAFAVAHCRGISRRGLTDPQPISIVTPAGIRSGAFDCRPVRVTATLRDALHDETDPNVSFLILSRGNDIIYAYSYCRPEVEAAARSLIGSSVRLDGVVVPRNNGERLIRDRILSIPGPEALCATDPGEDPFSAPDIQSLLRRQPREITTLGRHTCTGRVLCRWNRQVLLRTANGQLVRAELADPGLPPTDATVEFVGFPASDIYSINLVKARWRSLPGPANARLPASPVDIETLFVDKTGHARFDPAPHGTCLRFEGTVVKSSLDTPDSATLLVESGRHILPVHVGDSLEAARRLIVGTRVAISGICVVDKENWRPDLLFPVIKGYFFVTRDAEDLFILARPSWWTPVRLITVIGALLAILLGTCIWNLSLRRLAERRGQELSRESVARAESDIKTIERTRLSVELHDAIAQNLTSVAMEIEAAELYPDGADKRLLKHLHTASLTLGSCRTEIRNCLWDLRSHALEEPDFATAVRRTLLPHVRRTALSIRFGVPRTLLTDNTAHDVLRIIRELVLNGIRHGDATRVWIAGAVERSTLWFSVRDNGKGFDPEQAPGVADGHFGLQGIRERLQPLGGTLEIESNPGGTRAVVSIEIPHLANVCQES